MARTYVAISNPVHDLIRKITRQVPLRATVPTNGTPALEYSVSAVALPDAYYALARFHSLGGMSLDTLRRTRWQVPAQAKHRLPQQAGYFDVVRLDRRCSRDLRLKVRKKGAGLLAAELLAFGTGMLRARNDDLLEGLHQYLWRQHGRICTRHEVVYATIRALHENTLPLLYQARKESFDSTNLIYGDALGELEQLWDRRADTAFLEQVAQSLQPMRRHAEIAAYLHPPLNLPAVMQLHLRCQSVWKTPPATERSLLRRLEYILGNTTVDTSRLTAFRRPEPRPDSEVESRQGASAGWETDLTGYDGWLTGCQ